MASHAVLSKGNNYEHLVNWRTDAGLIHYGLRIFCSACSHWEVQPLPRGLKNTCPQSLADKVFRGKGWHLGRNRKSDVCPHCVERERAGRLSRLMNDTKPTLKPAPTVTSPKVIELATYKQPEQPKEENQEVSKTAAKAAAKDAVKTNAVAVEPPREMSRDDRRVIFAKLNEVYIDESKGYDNGWSDHRVAVDLGVPRAWVASVREEMFGPDKSNAEARQLVQDGRALKDEMQGWAAAQMRAVTVLGDDLKAFIVRIEEFGRKINSVEKLYR